MCVYLNAYKEGAYCMWPSSLHTSASGVLAMLTCFPTGLLSPGIRPCATCFQRSHASMPAALCFNHRVLHRLSICLTHVVPRCASPTHCRTVLNPQLDRAVLCPFHATSCSTLSVPWPLLGAATGVQKGRLQFIWRAGFQWRG